MTANGVTCASYTNGRYVDDNSRRSRGVKVGFADMESRLMHETSTFDVGNDDDDDEPDGK